MTSNAGCWRRQLAALAIATSLLSGCATDGSEPGIANACPARTIRTPTHRYVFNLSPETTFTTHITGCKTGPHHLPFWDSWIERAKTDPFAKATVQRYQQRPQEELYDLREDSFEMHNLADNPDQQVLLASLRKQLTEWCQAQGDTLAVEEAKNLH